MFNPFNWLKGQMGQKLSTPEQNNPLNVCLITTDQANEEAIPGEQVGTLPGNTQNISETFQNKHQSNNVPDNLSPLPTLHSVPCSHKIKKEVGKRDSIQVHNDLFAPNELKQDVNDLTRGNVDVLTCKRNISKNTNSCNKKGPLEKTSELKIQKPEIKHRVLRIVSNSPVSSKSPEEVKKSRLALRAAMAISGRCRECSHKFKENDESLSKKKGNNICFGCYRLCNLKVPGVNIDEVKHWLLTGELSEYVWDEEVDNQTTGASTREKVSDMESLFLKKLQSSEKTMKISENIPSKDEFFDLYLESQSRCAITGYYCHFSRDGVPKFWSATFNHIIPISLAPSGMDPWKADNIQVISKVMSKIKGDHLNEEVCRWFKLWKKSHV